MKSPRAHLWLTWRNIAIIISCTLLLLSVICIPLFVIKIQQFKMSALEICNSTKRWWEKPVVEYECHSGQKSLDQRLELLQDISRAFTNADIVHWLCYGTLWGVLRGGELLDYDKDGDICTVRVGEDRIMHIIQELPGDIYYVKNFSAFHIWRDLAQVHITLFQYTHIDNDNTDEFKILRRGFQRHFVPLDCLVEAFPQRFIIQPDLKLPLAKLNGVEFPVPHEGHEIMMYIYPDTWHLVRKPAGCT